MLRQSPGRPRDRRWPVARRRSGSRTSRRRRCGGERRIAFDHLDPPGLAAIEDQQLTALDGEGRLERARLIKSAEEIACIRHAIAVAELGMERMREALVPGMTENQLWSILHQTNIAHGGEWIETRRLSSGPRTNPWFRECSMRAIQAGEMVCFDTDLIGPYGYCADISRAWLCGDQRPTDEQRRLYEAIDDVQYGAEVLANLSDESSREITREMSADRIVSLLSLMEPDDAADVVDVDVTTCRVSATARSCTSNC